MRGPWRLLLLVAAVAAAVALFFLVRGEGDNGKSNVSTTFVRIDAFSNAPIRRIAAPKGQLIDLVVTAGRTDEVHVHGYDIKARVTPTRPARISFRARLAGRFEIELEEQSVQIAELTVEP